ncbi:MAG TPA: rhodanese-like domain-containing protein [Thermoanaerobaculia bacterium]|nr:rhodanese-like domain-containing protein [Thermoanaerobaculia bacterium]
MPRIPVSLVLEYPPAPPASSAAHFLEALSRSTDPSDVHGDFERGGARFLLLDARSREAFVRGHVPGAVNLHHRSIDAETASRFAKDVPIVTYCDGVHCNASTKAAAKLAALGFAVKEMIGGFDGWIREGYDVETGRGEEIATAGVAVEATRNVAADASGNVAAEATGNVRCGC